MMLRHIQKKLVTYVMYSTPTLSRSQSPCSWAVKHINNNLSFIHAMLLHASILLANQMREFSCGIIKSNNNNVDLV